MKGFLINIGNKKIDYLKGKKLDENQVITFFTHLGYQKLTLIKDNNLFNRHIILTGYYKNKKVFIKLATSKGISYLNKNEYYWYKSVSNQINVPQIYSTGYFKNYFYFVCQYLENNFVDLDFLSENLDLIINLSEKISQLKIKKLPADNFIKGKTPQEKFINKTANHLQSLPKKIIKEYNLDNLFLKVKNQASELKTACRYGDFNINHMILKNNQIYLIDGQLAMTQWVEYYDIAYLIQRIYSQFNHQSLAKKIVNRLLEKNYSLKKLTTILFARAIGGFLDEYIAQGNNYQLHNEFKNWIIKQIK